MNPLNVDVEELTDFMTWIESRRSVSKLELPSPSKEQIKRAVQCAMSAPDHKTLKPWRFIVTSGDARYTMGDVLLSAAQMQAERIGEKIDEKTRTKTLNMPLRAPTIITVITQFQYHEKVPKFEQLLSCGACVQNLILALQSQGFSTIWRTGILCNEPEVKRHFNIGAEDYVAGFIYVGTASSQVPSRLDINTDDYIKFEY